MGQGIWIFAAFAAAAIMVALTTQKGDGARQSTLRAEQAQYYVSGAFPPDADSFGSSGRALSTAAFGLYALQPATYNGEVVLEIIDASHLDETQKSALVQNLAAAEAGRADLKSVLADVRIALAIE